MPVRTTTLAHYDAVPAGTTIDLYTCPADETAILKDATVMNLTGGARDIGLSVRRATARAQIAWQPAMANLAVLTVSGRFIVLRPGDVLELFVGVGAGTGKVRAGAWGSELEGVAD
jgi:hypothetical protein